MRSTLAAELEKKSLIIFFLYILISIMILAYTGKLLYFAIIIFLPVALILLSYSKNNLLFLLIFYICLLPSRGWGERYDFFNYYVSTPIIVAIVGGAFLLWYLELLKKPYKVIKSKMDYSVLFLVLWLFFSFLWGMSKDHSLYFIYIELIFVSLYATYFLFRDVFRNEKELNKFLVFFVFISSLTSIQYILLFFSEADLFSFFLNRVTTQQPHIILIGYTILVNVVFFETNKRYRSIGFAAILLHLLAIFFSQQRALWGATFIGTIILIYINGRRSFSKRTWIYLWILLGVMIIGLIFVLIYVEELFGGSVVFTTLSRIDFIFNLNSDISLKARVAEIKVALNQWNSSPLIGTGLGSSISRFAKMATSNIVDNSYANYLWKMGVIGFGIFSLIIISFFQIGIRATRSSKKISEKNFITTLVIAFAALMIVALTNSSIFIYRFNIIWAMIFAAVHRYYDKNVTGIVDENLHDR